MFKSKIYTLYKPQNSKLIITVVCIKIFNSFILFYFRPVSAYALFFRDTQAAIKGQNPNASFGEVSKIVASMWDALDADSKNVSLDFNFMYWFDFVSPVRGKERVE